MTSRIAYLDQLFLLNLSLQLFDGVATYQGARIWGEGNPILFHSMAYFGVGVALLLFKAKACGLLVLLRRRGERPVIIASLTVVALCYGVFSFIPWMTRFLYLSLATT